MTFLRLHFEKLWLGTVLALLVGMIVLVMLGNGRVHKLVDEQRSAADRSLKAGEDIPLVASSSIDEVVEALGSEKNLFRFVAAPGQPGGSLLEPVGYMRCVNPKCNYLIAGNERLCPYCQSEQPPEVKDSYPREEDEDQDGVPNYVENNTPFLSSQLPKDAGWDSDGDGFTNLEEYRQGTSMASPMSTPPLALNLRIAEAPSPRRIPVRILRASQRVGADETQQWTINLEVVYTNSQNRNVRQPLRLATAGVVPAFRYAGRSYGPYTVAGVRLEKRGVGDDAKDVGIVTLAEGERRYEVAEGEFMLEQEPSVNLIFLGLRGKKHQRFIETNLRINKAKGEPFALKNFRSNQFEYYTVKSFTNESVTVERVRGTAGTGMDGGMGMDGMAPTPGGDMGMMGPMGMEGGGTTAVGTLAPPLAEKEARPVEFTVTLKYDPQRDLLDEPPPMPAGRFGPTGAAVPGTGEGWRR